jgi:hypothetical protein
MEDPPDRSRDEPKKQRKSSSRSSTDPKQDQSDFKTLLTSLAGVCFAIFLVIKLEKTRNMFIAANYGIALLLTLINLFFSEFISQTLVYGLLGVFAFNICATYILAAYQTNQINAQQFNTSIIFEEDNCDTELVNLIEEGYNKGEFIALTEDLKVKYDDLSGENLRERSLELVKHLRRRNRISDLEEHIKVDRPHLEKKMKSNVHK